ncbi:hypothetical protein JW979_05985 [bacterium]|nr:hypothetical protein [candidate division CSSED10-310 bacterium]
MNNKTNNEAEFYGLLMDAVINIEQKEMSGRHLRESDWLEIKNNPDGELPYHAIACPKCREKLEKMLNIRKDIRSIPMRKLETVRKKILAAARRKMTVDSIRNLMVRWKNTAFDILAPAFPADIAWVPLKSVKRGAAQSDPRQIQLDVLNFSEDDVDDTKLQATIGENIMDIAGFPVSFISCSGFFMLLPLKHFQQRFPGLTRENSEKKLKEIFENYDLIADIDSLYTLAGDFLLAEENTVLLRIQLTATVLRLFQHPDEILAAIVIMP